MRTLYDGVTASNLPTDAEIVAGYVEGRYTWTQADWNRFPHSIKLTIAIWSADADILDIETGDATPAMAPAWVARQRARGAFPTVYCNLSTWPAVQSALAAAGFVNGQHYDWWAAHYTQQPHLVAGSAATQYADPGPLDISLCQDYWPRGAQDMTPEEHDTQNHIFNFLLYGGDSKVSGKPYVVQLLEDIKKIQGAPATVDVAALASAIVSKLPVGTATLDPASAAILAKAVVDEIGVRVKPA